MIAYKGFTEELTATYGKGAFQYEPGGHYVEGQSKTRKTGFHSAEYILDCMNWYPLDGKNRFFQVEASGSIDEEEGCSMVVSTELTLVKELTLPEIALAAVRYMVEHPTREWEKRGIRLDAGRGHARGTEQGSIAIARGEHPVVIAKEGCVIGLVLETENGIEGAYVRPVRKDGPVKPDTWYTMSKQGKLKSLSASVASGYLKEAY